MKKAVVIGAGPGGLTTALGLAKEGLEVTVLEAHDKVGGLAQSWQHKPKLSNGERVTVQFELTHAISGFHEGGTKYNLFQTLGADMGRIGPFVAAPKFAALRAPGKRKLEILNDFDSNKKHLLDMFPDEAKGIGKFFDLLDRIDQERCTETRREGWQKTLERLVESKIENKYLKIPFYILTKPALVMRRNHTFQKYLDDCFRSSEIKAGLSMLYGYTGLPPSLVSGTLMNVMLLSYWRDGGPQAPKLGSFQILHNELARTFVETYNGDLQLRTKATGVDLHDGKVKGVEIERKGCKSFIETDCVIIAGDMKKSLLPLRKHLPKSYAERLRKSTMSLSLMNVYAVVEKDLLPMGDELGYAANVLVSSHDAIERSNGMNFPDEFALYVSVPTVLRPEAGLVKDREGRPTSKYHLVDIVMQSPPYNTWKDLKDHDTEEYKRLKRQYADRMIGIVDEILIPGLKDSVRYTDSYTATTHERFCNCTNGAVYTFAPTPKQFIPNRFSPRTPINGLWVSGAYVTSAGVGGAIGGAELATKMILKSLGK